MKFSAHLAAVTGASCLAGLAAISSANAQDAVSLEPLLDCRAIADPGERLACFDSAVVDILGEEEDGPGDLVVLRAESIRAVERDSFGMQIPSLPTFSLGALATGDELGLDAPRRSETTSAQEGGAARSQTDDETRSRVLARNDEGQIDRIEMIIDRVSVRGYETVIVAMTNGQVWEVVAGRNVRSITRRADAGSAAIIRRGSLGSYLMQIDGSGPAYRVQRRE